MFIKPPEGFVGALTLFESTSEWCYSRTRPSRSEICSAIDSALSIGRKADLSERLRLSRLGQTPRLEAAQIE